MAHCVTFICSACPSHGRHRGPTVGFGQDGGGMFPKFQLIPIPVGGALMLLMLGSMDMTEEMLPVESPLYG